MNKIKYRYFKNHIVRQIICICLFILCLLFLYEGIFITYSLLEIILSSSAAIVVISFSLWQFINDRNTLSVKGLEEIISEAMKEVSETFKNKKPEIKQYTHFGNVQFGAGNLSIWFFFETDSDLKFAVESGIARKIESMTTGKLIAMGYPKSSFSNEPVSLPDKIRFSDDSSEKNINDFIEKSRFNKVSISFSSEEDVMNKADGNLYVYLK